MNQRVDPGWEQWAAIRSLFDALADAYPAAEVIAATDMATWRARRHPQPARQHPHHRLTPESRHIG